MIPNEMQPDRSSKPTFERAILVAIAMFALLAAFAIGDFYGHSGPAKQVVELTNQASQLRSQIAALKADNSNLENQVAKLKQQLRKATAKPARKKPAAKTAQAAHHRRK